MDQNHSAGSASQPPFPCTVIICVFVVCGIILTAAEAAAAATSLEINEVAKNFTCGVDCQHGKCEDHSCVCDDGWKKFMDIPFLGCGIPQCDFNLSCDASKSVRPPPPPALKLNPCLIPFICGEGGDCQGGFLSLGYTCQCLEGFKNLFDSPSAMCFRSCQVGTSCSKLGIGIQPALEPPAAQDKIQAPSPSPRPSKGDHSVVSTWFLPILGWISLAIVI